MSAAFASRLAGGWVAVYTRGLPADVRTARRDEIESDLWSQREEANATGRPDAALSVEILLRVALGIPADVAWRLDRGRVADRGIERSTTVGTRIVALLAILGGIGVLIGTIPFVTLVLDNPGTRPWQLMQAGNAGSGVGQAALVVLCISLGGLGLVLVNRFESILGLYGLLGAAGGVIGLTGGYYALLLLPLGSAVVAFTLARFHVADWWVALIHVASAAGFLVVIGSMLGNTPIGNAVVIIPLFPISWVAIGLELLRGLPPPVRTARSASPRTS